MTAQEHVYLSVDLGGTSLRLCALKAAGEELYSKRLSSDTVRDPSDLISILSQEIKFILEHPDLKSKTFMGVALGVPGLILGHEGKVLQSPHFPKWNHLAIVEPLQAQLPIRVILENDANQAALAEAHLGAGQAWDDMIMLTLGTGIGGGIIYQKKIFHGSNGLAGEVGHMILERNGLVGALGVKGTLETMASASGLRLQIQELQGQPGTAKQFTKVLELDTDSPEFPLKLSQLAESGDEGAKQLWVNFGRALACGVASLANVLGIFRFVIGGGLLGAWDHFMPACREELPRRIYQSTGAMIEMVPAKLGERAGLLGAIPLLKEGA